MAGFNPYGPNFYMQDLQNMKDRIDRTMHQYQQFQNQFTPSQQPPITQNFQIAPNQPQSELQCAYVNGIDEVKNTFVMKNGIFVNKDLTTLWSKDVTGTVKTYELREVIELDEKDKTILEKDRVIDTLQNQINELKGEISYAKQQYTNTNTESNERVTTNKSSKVSRSKTNDGE